MTPPPPPRPLVRADQLRRTEPDEGPSEVLTARGRYFEADCLVGDLVKGFVRVTGPEVDGIPQVTTVDVTDPATLPAVGMIIEKSTDTRCVVLCYGETALVATTPGSRYWVGKNGQATATPPTADPSGVCMLQGVGFAIGTSRMLLHMDHTLVKLVG